jgi:hypothetical protein
MKYSSSLLAVVLAAVSNPSDAFTISHKNQQTHHHDVPVVSSFSSALYGRKKGGLGNKVSSGGVSTNKKIMKLKEKKEDTANKTKVSSSLSAWAATLKTKDDEASITESAAISSSTSSNAADTADSSASFSPFEDDVASTSTSTSNKQGLKKGSRRERSVQKQAFDSQKQAQINVILANITELIGTNNLAVQDLLKEIKSLTQLTAPNTLKAILNQNLKDYNLAWVGSDDAICHIGTGLHKVPLARLQDVFLTIGRDGSGESKTARLMEVISILGPFPNVRNTLQGKITDITSTEAVNADTNVNVPVKKDYIKICYDSMFDGLGKEISAGKEDNLRYVELEVVFADELALVCVVPKDGNGNGSDSTLSDFGEKGENVLLFLKEEDLDYKLEQLRAA